MNVALCRGEHKAGHEADGAVAQGAGRAVIMGGCHEEGDTEHRQTQYRDLFPHCETSPILKDAGYAGTMLLSEYQANAL